VKAIGKTLVNADSCRAALSGFWNEHLRIEESKDGVLLALPLLYPDGLQVVLKVIQISDTSAILSDRGEALSRLGTAGIDLTLDRNVELLESKLKAFELQRDGFDLQKPIHFPIDGLDIHLFGEALVSIAHLIYRHELASPKALHVYNAIRGLLRRKNFDFKEGEDAVIIGRVEPHIRVDFLVVENHVLACKTIERRGRMRDYIEQWGFRWMDAKRRNETLVRAMFYDPENQEWDEDSKRIGENVCEMFHPYFEVDKISADLDRYRNAA
jgi:hypothetical protein